MIFVPVMAAVALAIGYTLKDMAKALGQCDRGPTKLEDRLHNHHAGRTR